MALNAAVNWEVRTTGNDANGGGFHVGASGTDRSQQDLAQATLTIASTVHTTTTQINVAAGDYTVVAADVGNLIQISGGTATAGFYEITAADTVNNRWTLDRSAGASGATVVAKMGGAVASLGKIGAAVVGANIVYVKAGSYSISVNTANVSNGYWSNSGTILIIGYTTNRAWGNIDTGPVFTATVGLTNGLLSGNATWLYNFTLDANAQSFTKQVNGCSVTRCALNNNRASNVTGLATHCTATGNSGTVFSNDSVFCEAWANTGTPFVPSNASVAWCLSYANTGASTDGFAGAGLGSSHYFGCVAYGNGRDGFNFTASNTRGILQNCIAEGNTGWGIHATQLPILTIRCAFFNNGSGTTTGVTETDTLSPSGSVFTNAAAGDFSLNNTASAGALLRAAGFSSPGSTTFPRGLSTSYLDVGAVQHQDSGSVSATFIPIITTSPVFVRSTTVPY